MVLVCHDRIYLEFRLVLKGDSSERACRNPASIASSLQFSYQFHTAKLVATKSRHPHLKCFLNLW